MSAPELAPGCARVGVCHVTGVRHVCCCLLCNCWLTGGLARLWLRFTLAAAAWRSVYTCLQEQAAQLGWWAPCNMQMGHGHLVCSWISGLQCAMAPGRSQ